MRRRINRPTLETVFVLGAGASHDASWVRDSSSAFLSPLDKDFCQRIQNYPLTRSRPKWVKNSAGLILHSWQDRKPFIECGLEEAVQLQAAHLNFLNAIQPRRLPKQFGHDFKGNSVNKALTTEWNFIYHLAHLIAYTLLLCEERSNQPLRRFVRRFFLNRVCNGRKTELLHLIMISY